MFWEKAHNRHQYSVNGVSSHIINFVNEALHNHQVYGSSVKIFESGAGCGRNILYSKTILNNRAKYFATDISPSALDQIVCLQIEKLVADMRDGPVKSNFITHAISWRCLHCLDSKGRREALNEKRRIITPHGSLLLAVRSNEDFHYGYGEQTEPGSFAIVDQSQNPPGLIFYGTLPPSSWHYFHPRELTNLLEQSGFYVKSINHLTESPGTFKYQGVKNSYWGVRAIRERRDMLWTGVSFNLNS